jgi:peptidoglycan-associated lipoprotein
MKNFREAAVIATAALTMVVAGCSKKVAATPPPAPAAQRPAVANNNSAPPSNATERAVSQPAPAPPARSSQPDAATRARIDQLLARIEDAYFDYNEHSLRPDAVKALQSDSSELRDILKDYPHYKLTIEGYCDERGSAEYNIALGEKRAESAKDYLVQVGIPAGQLGVVSYGKEKPVCEEHDEACWQKNRRIHITANATN